MLHLGLRTGEMLNTDAKLMANALLLEGMPVEKVIVMKQYAVELRRKHPTWKPARLQRKVAEKFNVKLI